MATQSYYYRLNLFTLKYIYKNYEINSNCNFLLVKQTKKRISVGDKKNNVTRQVHKFQKDWTELIRILHSLHFKLFFSNVQK